MDGVNFANARQAATLAVHKPCSSTMFLITEGASVVPWMATGTNSGNSGSESWLKYLNRSPSEGMENSEAEPASRNPEARDSDPREEIGPSSVRQRVDSANALRTVLDSHPSHDSQTQPVVNPGRQGQSA
ncbi:hypothetical protein Ahy_B05g075865 [Arachis hypogaea]|uniref:Uncharacterized protein n=1 Tax=Arachis hypogaea TaxID=3818 RepID=A0A444Z249_ARAHY|nr:hypothetical protein Ahy_B05g075865 [Arachis hypogaea]